MVALVVPAMNPHVAAASPVDQQRARVESIVDELERLEEQANDIAEDYVEAIDAKATLDAEIVELEADIAAKEVELAELRADLGDMAVRSFVGSGTTPLGPLFEDTGDINDVLQRDQLARVALSAGDVSTDELDAFVSDLEDDRDVLEGKVAEAETLAASLVDAQAETEQLTGEYEQARIDAEAELGQLIVEEEARRAAESAARLQAEFEAAQTQSTNNSGGAATTPAAATPTPAVAAATPAATTNSGGGGNTSAGGGSAPAPVAAAPPPSSRAGVAVQRRARPAGSAVPLRHLEPRRLVRLLRADRLRLGSGRRVPAAPVTCPVRLDPARRQGVGTAGRPALLLQPDQPRGRVPRRRSARARSEHRQRREGRQRQLGQGLRRRPPRLIRFGSSDPCVARTPR